MEGCRVAHLCIKRIYMSVLRTTSEHGQGNVTAVATKYISDENCYQMRPRIKIEITGLRTARGALSRLHPSPLLASLALAADLCWTSLPPQQERLWRALVLACVAEELALKDGSCWGQCVLAT
jgi:hypothetical protein